MDNPVKHPPTTNGNLCSITYNPPNATGPTICPILKHVFKLPRTLP